MAKIKTKTISNLNRCPNCNEEMRKFEISYGYYQCQRCGYQIQSLNIKANTLPSLQVLFNLITNALVAFVLSILIIKLLDELFK